MESDKGPPTLQVAGGISHRAVFQPIIRLDGGKIVAFEALSRFSDERSPHHHLVEAREDGHFVDFELELMAAAIVDCQQLPDTVMVTMNASAETILDPRLPEMLADGSHAWGIELSEFSAVESYEPLRDVLGALGVVLLIDDAGTKYSDIKRVMDARPSIVKVDKSVLDAATGPHRDRRALDEYLRASRSVGAIALVEGVERPEQAQLLMDAGFQLAQGFYFGMPAPASEWAEVAAAQGL